MIDPDPIYCDQCGTSLRQKIPAGEDRIRGVCTACDLVHYRNPRVVVGTLIEHDEKILLCKRAIEPAYGAWTPPAGFLELGESSVEGAVRETWEEAKANVEIIQPFVSIDLPRIGQIHVKYLARMKEPHFEPGPESLEVEWFHWNEIPWDHLAFPVTHWALRLRQADREQNQDRFHRGTLKWKDKGSPLDFNSYDLSDLQSYPLKMDGSQRSRAAIDD